MEGNTQQLDKIDTVSKDETKGNTDTLDLSATANKDEYFEVLNYEQDDIVHLSKKDIIKHQPTVQLLRLWPDEIRAAQQKNQQQ